MVRPRTVVLVKNGINHQYLPQPSEGLQETAGVRVKIVEGEFNLYSVHTTER